MPVTAVSGVHGLNPWSGGRGTKPPEAESFFVFGHATGG